eukprot:m.138808 g.138808  ORF g.138808 m.138808 type:complete len:627 (-) comp14783_c0_seq2:135-2015(-)
MQGKFVGMWSIVILACLVMSSAAGGADAVTAASEFCFARARPLVQDSKSFFVLSCQGINNSYCLETRGGDKIFANPRRQRVVMKVTEFVSNKSVGVPDISESLKMCVADYVPSGDGKTLLHAMAVIPGLSMDTLKSCVVIQSALWIQNHNRTLPRQPLVDHVGDVTMKRFAAATEVLKPIVNMQDEAGNTALHLAAAEGAIAPVKWLLEMGANTNLQNNNGQTPIHTGAGYGSLKIIEMLLKHGAKRDIPDIAGNTFDDYLKQAGAAIMPHDALQLGITQRAALVANMSRKRSEPSADCEEGGGWFEDNNPGEHDHDLGKCDVDQVDDISADDWYKNYYLQRRPILIRNALTLAERCPMSKKSFLKARGPATPLRVGATAYPSITKQKSCPQLFHVEDLEMGRLCNDTTPDGDKYSYVPIAVQGALGSVRGQGSFWHDVLPSRFQNDGIGLSSLCSVLIHKGNKQLFIGGKHGGATMHFHSAAINSLFFGTKQWYLLPSNHAELSGMPVDMFIKDAKLRGHKMYTCTQNAGDILLLPRIYGHATYNPKGLAIGLGALYNEITTELQEVMHHSEDWQLPRSCRRILEKTNRMGGLSKKEMDINEDKKDLFRRARKAGKKGKGGRREV